MVDAVYHMFRVKIAVKVVHPADHAWSSAGSGGIELCGGNYVRCIVSTVGLDRSEQRVGIPYEFRGSGKYTYADGSIFW